MTRYNTKSQQNKKTMQKRIGSKKLRKVGNGNIFQNLIPMVVNLFKNKSYYFFCNAADPEILSYMDWFFIQRKADKTQISLAA